MTTTDDRSAGMHANGSTSGRFSKLRTLAGRVLRRGPVGPQPVRHLAPAPVPSGVCTARWCLAHDHGATTTDEPRAVAHTPADVTPVRVDPPVDVTPPVLQPPIDVTPAPLDRTS
jgi:hypothetical protein